MQVVTDYYRSPSAIIKACDRPVNNAWKERCRSSKKHEDWGAVETFEEALDKADEGFTEVTEDMKDTFEASKKYVFERIEPKNAIPINDYVGSTPNVARAILGLPKDMRRVDTKKKKQPGIRLVYEIGLNCGYGDDQLIEYGARMLTLVALCIRQQIPVELTISDTCIGPMHESKYLSIQTRVKNFSDKFNIRKISYWMAHPSVHRRIFFAILETSPLVEEYDSGYGYPITNSRSTCEEMKKIFLKENNSFFFSCHDFRCDEDIIKAWERITGEKVD